MPSINRVTLLGNLTRDPELRVTPKGTSICQFSLALNREWKNDKGEKQEEVTFVDCEAWGKTGENSAKYLAKGRLALIEGRLRMDQWDDKKTGEKRSRMKIVADAVTFIGGGNRNGAPGDKPASNTAGSTPQTAARTEANQQPAQKLAAQTPATEDEIPF